MLRSLTHGHRFGVDLLQGLGGLGGLAFICHRAHYT